MIKVEEEYCPKNHPCPVVNVCPYDAISQESPFTAPKVDEELCTDCGTCTIYCPAFRQKQETSY